MADFAILTGISWYPNPGYSNLDGPPNDIALMETWLTERAGLDPGNIRKVVTPSPLPDPVDLGKAPPVGLDFDLIFNEMLQQRIAMGRARVSGRLYLYFSGHGFCNRSQNAAPEAALYCANATKTYHPHLFGTQLARVAQGQALFKEVVLIMDCCRDSELARTPTPHPYRDTPDDGLAAQVHLLAIYAAPKGGKAQERAIPERGGAVHGLLTHALVKLLEELPSRDAAGIASVDLRNALWNGWKSICGEDAAPQPEVLPPQNGEIYFPLVGKGTSVEFVWIQPPTDGATLTLIDNQFQEVATFNLAGAANDTIAANGPVLHHERVPQGLRLRMRPGPYLYRLSDPAKEAPIKVEGGDCRVNL